MTEYTVKIAFWLRAFDSVTVDAELRHGGHRLANAAAKIAMESGAFPEHIDIAERRQGVIAFIDRHEPDAATPCERTSRSMRTATWRASPVSDRHRDR